MAEKNHIHEGTGSPTQDIGEPGDIFRDDTGIIITRNEKGEPVHINTSRCTKWFKWFDVDKHKTPDKAEWITLKEAFAKGIF